MIDVAGGSNMTTRVCTKDGQYSATCFNSFPQHALQNQRKLLQSSYFYRQTRLHCTPACVWSFD